MDYDEKIREYETALASLKKERHNALRETAKAKRTQMPDSVKEYFMQNLRHTSSYCSDDDPNNAYMRKDEHGNEYLCIRCPKCAFIKLMNGELDDEYTFDISVHVYPIE